MKGQQLLRDEYIQPTDEIIGKCLGNANNVYVKFIEGVKQDGITLMDWRYYNDGKAWLSKGEYRRTTPRGANKVTPIFWLSIWDGFFKVSFFFGSSVRDELLSLPISRAAKDLICSANPMGKTMRFVPVVLEIDSDSQLSDVYELAQLRKTKMK